MDLKMGLSPVSRILLLDKEENLWYYFDLGNQHNSVAVKLSNYENKGIIQVLRKCTAWQTT